MLNRTKLLPKFFKWTFRYGFLSAFKLFFIAKFSRKLVSIPINREIKQFYIRGNSNDRGALINALLYQDYYKIEGFNPRTILDVGANCGDTAIVYKMLFPNAKIFSLEPEINNFRILEMNTKQYENIYIFNTALWHRDESIILDNVGEENHASFQFKGIEERKSITSKDTVVIQGKTLMSFCKEINIQNIDVLKIDIEGAEKDIFEGDTSWLDIVSMIFIELHDNKIAGCGHSFFSATLKYDFLYFIRGEYIVAAKKGLSVKF